MKRLLNLELTTVCYANCYMCPRNAIKEHGIINDNTIDDVIRFAKKQSLFEISLSGRGEPTLHPDICKIINRIKVLEVPISIVTTTDGINDRNMKDILDIVDILRISVSSIAPEIFHKVHQGLEYKKIWDNIEKIVNYKPEKIHIHLVGGSIIYPGLEKTIEFFNKKGINNIYLFPLWNRAGNLNKDEENFRKKIIEKYNIFYSEDEYMDHEKSELLMSNNYCPIGDSSIMINYKGEFIGCFQDFENKNIIGKVDNSKDLLLLRKKFLGCMQLCKVCNSKKVINNEY